jgi:hypothetical protein
VIKMSKLKITSWEVIGYDKKNKRIKLTEFISEDTADMVDKDIHILYENPPKDTKDKKLLRTI